MTPFENEWMRPKQAAVYCSVSLRTLYIWFNDEGLKFSKVGKCRLIKRSNLDAFLSGFEVASTDVDQIVDSVLSEVRG